MNFWKFSGNSWGANMHNMGPGGEPQSSTHQLPAAAAVEERVGTERTRRIALRSDMEKQRDEPRDSMWLGWEATSSGGNLGTPVPAWLDVALETPVVK